MLYRRGARVGRIYSLAVAPAARGRGLALDLLAAAEADAMARGCDRARLEVRGTNAPAIALYGRAGYRVIERIPAYYADGGDALRMEKKLPVGKEAIR